MYILFTAMQVGRKGGWANLLRVKTNLRGQELFSSEWRKREKEQKRNIILKFEFTTQRNQKARHPG